MLDWISSKVGMIFAAMVIAAAMLGFFAWQKNQIQDVERQNMSDYLADQIDHVSTLSSEHRTLVTFEPDKEAHGVLVPKKLGDRSYDIEITQNLVIVTQEGEGNFVTKLVRSVHPWDPDAIRGEDVFNETMLREIDRGNRSLTLTAGQDFYIENMALDMTYPDAPLQTEYHTFVYKA